MLLELYVDRLANDSAALALEPALRSLEPVSDQAHELLGVAAQRAGEFETALRHLDRCAGERAAEALAAGTLSASEAGAWGLARRAWALLLALAPPGGEAPASPRLQALREGVRAQLSARAAGASEAELEADAALVRFVKEFAPEHPWLGERRQSERALRVEASSRILLERAEASAKGGDHAGVERALAALSRAEATGVDTGRVEALRAWAKLRRDDTLAERAFNAATAGAFEEAGRAFLELPPRARDGVLATGEPLFAALEAIRGSAPGRTADRTLVAAAAAWVRARAATEAAERWRLLAPHAALLEGVPGLADELRALRPPDPPRRPLSVPPPAPQPIGPREVWSAGVRLAEIDETEVDATEVEGVAARALRDGTSFFVVSLERHAGADGVYDLVLRPTAPHLPTRRIRLEGPAGWRLRGPLVVGGRVVVIDEGLIARSVDASPGLETFSFALAADPLAPARGAFVAIGDRLIALEITADGPARWALFDAATGAACGELGGPQLHAAQGASGATFYRTTETCVERLTTTGVADDRLDLPSGVSPLAVIESPLGGPPVVLAPLPSRPEIALWWQPHERLFRSFALFDTAEHGDPIEAVTFPGKALCVVTRRADGEALLHTVWADRDTLRARRCALGATGHLALVTDPAGRRGWAVRRDEQGRTHLGPLSLRPDDP